MSADNWTVCPKCKQKAEADAEERVRVAAESYGKVSAKQYDYLLGKANEGVVLESSLREDYEFHMDNEGQFLAVYHGRCQQCDFQFHFRHEETAR